MQFVRGNRDHLQQFEGRSQQLFLTMEYSHLVVAAILCSIGYVYCDDGLNLAPCTYHPGNLYIFQTKVKSLKGANAMFTIKVSSETISAEEKLERFGVVKWEKIPVYDCLIAMKATKHALQTEISNKGEIFFFLPRSLHKQLVDLITDVVALWTEGDEWKRVCTHESGYVYILFQNTIVDDPTFGKGRVFRIKGASGDAFPYEIHRIPKYSKGLVLLEAARFQVGDCKGAITSISRTIDGYESDGMIKRTEQFGNNAFYVSDELGGKNFINIIEQAVHQTVNVNNPWSKKVVKFFKQAVHPLRLILTPNARNRMLSQ